MNYFGNSLSISAFVLGIAVATSPSSAQSRCEDCGKAATTKTSTSYNYKTVQRVSNVTQYKDVNRVSYQKHVHRVVNVTRVQPIRRVNVVTRVHNRTVILRQTQNVAQTAMLPTKTVTTGQTVHISHKPTYSSCSC